MFSKKHSIIFIVIAVAALAIAPVAHAAHVTINTDNNQVDAAWSGVSMFYGGGESGVPDNYDIAQAWIGSAADNSEFYFRINLAGTGLLPVNSALEAELDCDGGGFGGSADVSVQYQLLTGPAEILVECQGDGSACDVDGPPGTITALGEEILGSPNNYEWKANVSGGSVNWSACLGTVNVRFRSWDLSAPPETPQDETATGGYNVVTPVTLASFTAQDQVLPVAAIVLGAVTVGSLLVIRRRKEH